MLRVKSKFCWLWLWLALAASVSSAEPPVVRKADDKASGKFIRVARDKQGSVLALETAIVHCAPAKGDRRAATVDLIAAVHIADASYYRQLNREFEQYDAVLYELVAPERARVPKPGESGGSNPVSLVQNGMKDLLNLEFQLKGIDYARKNMVHADMSPQQLAESMRHRNESVLGMIVQAMGYAMADQDQGEANAKLLAALLAENRSLALKRVFAEQFEKHDGMMAAWEGNGGSTIISGRNQVALDVLRKQIAAGKKKIAIFYGAGHMPDLQQRLQADFGLLPANTRWLPAWNLKEETKPK